MTSQLNNSNDNNDQVLQETDSLRTLFFEQQPKRNPSVADADQAKRARLGASVIAADPNPASPPVSASEGPTDPLTSSLSPQLATLLNAQRHHPQLHHRHMLLQHHILGLGQPMAPLPSTESAPQQVAATDPAYGRKSSVRSSHLQKKSVRIPPVSSSASTKAPKLFRRFRSRSLPIINYTSKSHVLLQLFYPKKSHLPFPSANAKPLRLAYHSHLPSPAPSLPPINLQSLKEIDLQEILKNPQLRHDILFDPQLQFRPNLDGDRGRKKKSIIEKYWVEIENECKKFFAPPTAESQTYKVQRLPALFTTLRDILLSLLPAKDRAPVSEIMDVELVVQQLTHGSFDFVAMAQWLGEVFKSHCAPMRDQWVSEMISKFQDAQTEHSVSKLVQGLRLIFSILEAMKLDVANHQIRILRPVLIETAVDFEKDYFNQLINHCKIDISDSLKWFFKNYHKKVEGSKPEAPELKFVITSSIIDLLSCRNMATEFPSTLAFDHTRLVLLRADVRQLVCVQLCIILFKQLIVNYDLAVGYRQLSLKAENITRVQEEVLAIVTDDNGNVKWTRNIQALSIQIAKNVVQDPRSLSQRAANLPQPLVDFCHNWLIKQIQPSSDVYGAMESRIFKELLEQVERVPESETLSAKPEKAGDNLSGMRSKKADSEMAGIANRISTLVKFHWCVFGDFYTQYLHKHREQL